MPELPEVETIVRCLTPKITGKTAKDVEVLWHKTAQGDVGLLRSVLPGARLLSVSRRAKLALLHFEPDIILAFHLKMSGALLLKDRDEKPGSHVRLVLNFTEGENLHFDDTRKFGYCRILRQDALPDWPFYSKLGPEPLEIDIKDFVERFSGRGRAIKALLLDQTMIAGVGNIYADESLYAAGILPTALASGLSPEALGKLHGCLQNILDKAIEGCGTSLRDYLDAEGRPGAFQNELLVYGRGGEKCFSCGRILKTAKVAGRTTTYCPKCQKSL